MLSPISPTKHVAGRLEATTRVSSSTKKYGRGIRAAILSVICAAVGVSGAHATTVSWGSEIYSDFRTSDGEPLGDTFVDEGFTIQLGYFADTLPGVAFIPNDGNIANWITQWRVFDQASLNLGLDYFTSEAEVNQGGTSSSSFGTAGANFEGETAYIWIRNGTDQVPGTEWFLATAATWTFPIGSDECCDPVLPVQFSLTDLDPMGDPVFGGQNNRDGLGFYTDPNATSATNPYTLQTYTFVPEPSSFLLTLMGSCLLLIRRRPAA